MGHANSSDAVRAGGGPWGERHNIVKCALVGPLLGYDHKIPLFPRLRRSPAAIVRPPFCPTGLPVLASILGAAIRHNRQALLFGERLTEKVERWTQAAPDDQQVFASTYLFFGTLRASEEAADETSSGGWSIHLRVD